MRKIFLLLLLIIGIILSGNFISAYSPDNYYWTLYDNFNIDHVADGSWWALTHPEDKGICTLDIVGGRLKLNASGNFFTVRCIASTNGTDKVLNWQNVDAIFFQNTEVSYPPPSAQSSHAMVGLEDTTSPLILTKTIYNCRSDDCSNFSNVNMTMYKLNSTYLNSSITAGPTSISAMPISYGSGEYFAAINTQAATSTTPTIFWVDELWYGILRNKLTMNTAIITPSVLYTGDTLEGSCNTSNSAGTDLTYYFRWYKNDTLNNSGYNSTSLTQNVLYNIDDLANTETTWGETWIFSCLANNGTVNSSVWLNSTGVVISSAIPVIETIQILPYSIFYDTDVLEGWANVSYASGDNITIFTRWYRNNKLNRSGQITDVVDNLNLYDSVNFSEGKSFFNMFPYREDIYDIKKFNKTFKLVGNASGQLVGQSSNQDTWLGRWNQTPTYDSTRMIVYFSRKESISGFSRFGFVVTNETPGNYGTRPDFTYGMWDATDDIIHCRGDTFDTDLGSSGISWDDFNYIDNQWLKVEIRNRGLGYWEGFVNNTLVCNETTNIVNGITGVALLEYTSFVSHSGTTFLDNISFLEVTSLTITNRTFIENLNQNIQNISPTYTQIDDTWFFSISAGGGVMSTNFSNSTDITIREMPTLTSENNTIITLSHAFNLSYQMNVTGYNLIWNMSDNENLTLNQSGFINITSSINAVGEFNTTINMTDGRTNISIWLLFNITNGVPNITSLVIVPSPATSDDNLTFTNVTIDDDNDTITDVHIRWYNNSVFVDNLENQTKVFSDNTSSGESWFVSLAVFDGLVWSSFMNSSAIVINDSTSPIINDLSLSTTTMFTDQIYTFFANCTDASSDLEYGFPIVERTDPTGTPKNDSMTSVAGNKFSKVFSAIIAGSYNHSVFCNDQSGNKAENRSTGLILTSILRTTPPSGGGGGGGVTIQDLSLLGNLTGFCGDNICQDDENPANCFNDCKVNYDTLIRCLFEEDLPCNWDQNWFPAVLIVFLLSIVGISFYISDLNKKRK